MHATQILTTDSFKWERNRTKRSGHSNLSCMEEGISPTNLPSCSRISRTLSDEICRSLLYTMPTGTPLRSTLSNTNASERTENRSSPCLRNANIYIYIYEGEAFQSIFSLALQVLYMHFLPWIQKNQYCGSNFASTFEAVLHLQRKRPTSEFSQYLSCPWPPSGLPPRCYASA